MPRTLAIWTSIAFGLLAAIMWLRASTVKVRSDDYLKRLRKAGAIGPNEVPAQITEGDFNLLESLKASGRWNAWAAVVTAVSVAAQAVANMLPSP